MNTLNPAFLPRVSEPVVGQGGLVTKAWENFFLRLASAQSSDDLRQLYEALAARVAELEDGQGASFQIFGQQSVVVQGTPADGIVFLTLQGDESSPGVTEYYGTGPTGTKGWFPVSGTITVNGSELTKTVGADGIVTLGLADVADSGAGVLLATTFDSKGRKTGSKAATITGTAQQINVANGNAAAGLPTLSLASEVLASLGKADSAVQSIVPGVGITVNNTDPRNPIVSAPASGFGPPPTDDSPYVGLNGVWERTNAADSRFWLIEYPLLTDQAGNQLTDQAGNFLMGNSPIVPPGWPSTTTVINTVSSGTLQSMTLAQANALASPSDFQMVAITDLTGGREPCWYDATVASGTKWRRFSDRSIAN